MINVYRKLIPSILIFCLLLTGCGNQTPKPPAETAAYEQGSYVLLVYICGSNLESSSGAATKNISEMLSAKLPAKTTVVFQTGGTKKWRDYNIPSNQSCRYEIRDGQLMLVEQRDTVNMGDAQSLSDFLLWAYNAYSAEKYGLILWDHGGGSVKGVCYDENFGGDALKLPELKTALSAFYEGSNRKLDFIGFDACLMATVETLFTVGPFVNNMVASEELEPSGGWDYKVLLENLGRDDFYNKLLSGYAEKSGTNDYYTLSHIDSSDFGVIAKALDGLLVKMKAAGSPRDVISAFSDAVSFGTEGTNLYDLGNLFSFFGVGVHLDEHISSVNGAHRSSATGLSIYFPLGASDSLSEYCQYNPYSVYSDFLNDWFLRQNEEIIQFASYSENIHEMLSFTLQAESMDYVGSVEYVVYGFSQSDPYQQKVFALGNDDDVEILGNRVNIRFEGKWVEFAGHLLYCKIIDKQEESTIYEAPIKVNGEKALLLFAHNKDDWSIQIIGVSYENEEFSRIHKLKAGDRIIGVVKDVTYFEVENFYPSENEFIYDETQSITIVPLPDGYYQYSAYVSDIYGKRYLAGTAIVEITDGIPKIFAITDSEVAYPD